MFNHPTALKMPPSNMDPLSQIVPALGEESLRNLVRSFYKKIRTDDLIGPMYPQDDWEGAEQRLSSFLIYRFGGSPAYLQERGHPRLRARHLPFAIGINERNRWLKIMNEAMQESQIPKEQAVWMTAFFEQVADSMRNQPE
jgi:hemoglobin